MRNPLAFASDLIKNLTDPKKSKSTFKDLYFDAYLSGLSFEIF
jgi:hypothetical protein